MCNAVRSIMLGFIKSCSKSNKQGKLYYFPKYFFCYAHRLPPLLEITKFQATTLFSLFCEGESAMKAKAFGPRFLNFEKMVGESIRIFAGAVRICKEKLPHKNHLRLPLQLFLTSMLTTICDIC
jgi:hypothetical protein